MYIQARKHAEHVSTQARKHAKHVSTQARQARDLADSEISWSFTHNGGVILAHSLIIVK